MSDATSEPGESSRSGPPEELWGGRFRSPLHPRIRSFTGSLAFDRRLVRHDLIGSLAHARVLRENGVLEPEDADEILAGLSGMLEEVEAGELAVEGSDEDVHSWIERTLHERIGPPAARLHAGRSRNDQTSVALRLLVREELERVLGGLAELVEAWRAGAGEHLESWMPAYTHLQRAQPVSLAHHLLAHAWASLADADRLRAAHAEAGRSPLGSGAAAGTSLPVDPERTAELLGFRSPYPNSLHAVADRDYAVAAVFACTLVGVHLSRWAEEIVLWSSSEFGFVELPDSLAQGSSLMPQKKNPEAAEIVRGKSGRMVGDLVSLLTVLKGLPLAYNSDLQEDKEPLFDALDTARETLSCATVVARDVEFRTDRMGGALGMGHVTATDLAEALVRKGVPFREAHEAVGRLVLEAEARGRQIRELSDATLVEVLAGFPVSLEAGELEALRPDRAVRAHAGRGGPAPERVEEQLGEVDSRLRELRAWLEGRRPPPILRAHRGGGLTGEELDA